MDPNISFSLEFLSWEAGTAAGLDMWKWENGEYPISFQSKVCAWYKLHHIVKMHIEEAVAEKQERDAKRK